MPPQTPPLPTLPLHLMLSLTSWLSSPFAWRCANAAWAPSKAKSPRRNAALQQAVEQEAKNRAHSLLSGLLRYSDTPYARNTPEPPCIWRRGSARLLDYGTDNGNCPIMLVIPSLINRYYILDLEKERSLLRYLAAQNIHPLVLDWGAPGEREAGFNCGDYVTDILISAIDYLHNAANQPILLAGYCMGGVLALAAAQLKPRAIAGLALFAAPWNFHCDAFKPFVIDHAFRPMLESILAAQGTLTPAIVQSLFYLTDPFLFEQKFRRFSGLPEDSREAREFIALERWVNDGVPMTAHVARDCLLGWAQNNALMTGQWRIGSTQINPRRLHLPTFIALPRNDHVVPTDCAQPLADAIPHATLIRPGSGHVGMIVGSKARRELWQPLAEWAKKIT